MSLASSLDGFSVSWPASSSSSNTTFPLSVFFSASDKFSTYQGIIFAYSRACFLATPQKQAKDMFLRKRIWFTVAYLGSTIVTIVLAATLPAHLRYLIIISLIVELISYFFYTLSFIPFGQKILRKIFKAATDQD